MRVLVCGINYAPDLVGVAKYNTELCESLSAYGHDVRIVTAPPYYPAWKTPPGYRGRGFWSENSNGVRVTRAPIYVPSQPSGLKRLIHHGSFGLSSAPPVVTQALRWRPHVMFSVAPSLASAATVALAARWAGAVSWLHLQDFEIDAAFELRLLRNQRFRAPMLSVEQKILRAFDRVSTISPRMLQRLESKTVDPKRLRELRNWVDTNKIIPGERMTRFRRELGLGEFDVVALYSGSISNKQGLELVVEAARLSRSGGRRLTFVLCGDGPRKAELQAQASGFDNVHFLGFQPEDRLSELLNTADLHLLPQRAEAADLVLPSKLGGIFASGRPVIAMTAAGSGLADEVEGAGLAVAPGDSAALAAAAQMLADNSELRYRLGANARRRATERWDKVAILRALEGELLALSS